ncbi:sugar phosphate isomerase/epimerase family protein [Cohnella fermenti]|uniref:Sugar phosphate isomerase/epimerase n=1 Tax=Cohnella fermenti TaxID=2565925 RepID=A0A4S4C4N7_9BACL|nr:sugar phosphate isomerase/epimerase [Cohnella fermenti]THF82114.1 sugar phosphate isomerase/epimerase [Cohnella fermenti]
MELEFGLQLYSVRDELDKDYAGTLEKIAEIGYRYVELAFHQADKHLNVGGMTPSQLKDTLDRLGLKVVSAHMDPMEKFDWERVIAFNQELGNTSIGKGIAFFGSAADIREISLQLNRYGEICRKHDMDFYYHNHFQEFQRIDGRMVLESILELTDESLVKIELDTYWALRGGIDPLEWLRKLGERCDLVHQKDLPSSVEPVNAFDTVGGTANITYERFAEFSKPEFFAEIGEGIIDIPSIIAEIRRLGYGKYMFVEQDHTNLNQLESVAISYRNMARLFAVS